MENYYKNIALIENIETEVLSELKLGYDTPF